MDSNAKTINYGFSRLQWTVLQKEVFQQFWLNGGLIYYLGPKSIMALVPGYTDPNRKVEIKRALESSWQEKNLDPDANLSIIEIISNEQRASIREVIHNPYRRNELLLILLSILVLVGVYSLILVLH